MMGSLLGYLFGCAHRNLSRPMTPLHSRGNAEPTYVVCLDCGKRFAYDWKQMRVGSLLQPLPSPSQAHALALAAHSSVSKNV